MLLILLACPAEDLGIELPRGGVASISPEDLGRDHWALGREEPVGFFTGRMRQMHVAEIRAGTGWACALLDRAPVRRIDAPWPADDASRASVAMLISLAKSFDGEARPAPLALCMRADPGALPADLRALPAASADPGPLDVPPDFRRIAPLVRALRGEGGSGAAPPSSRP